MALIVAGRKHEDRRARRGTLDRTHGLEAALLRYHDVEHDDVRLVQARHAYACLHAERYVVDDDIVFRTEQQAQSRADERVVVDDHHVNHDFGRPSRYWTSSTANA